MNSDVEFEGLSHGTILTLEFVIILQSVPKVNKLSVPIFLKKKRDFTTYGLGKKVFN
jgi:hypothetical protein